MLENDDMAQVGSYSDISTPDPHNEIFRRPITFQRLSAMPCSITGGATFNSAVWNLYFPEMATEVEEGLAEDMEETMEADMEEVTEGGISTGA